MFDITLVIPTYGRYKEVDLLLESICKQTHPLNKVEVIIVDQNNEINISPLINKYNSVLNIVHKKTTIKGIANAKNTGIQISSAPIVTFPDDDCTYYEDTISSALLFFKENPNADIVFGRVYDREKKINIMRNWAQKKIRLNLYNFHLNYSAITCFTRRKELLFDPRFGVGAKYSSGEELDYVISAIKKSYNVFYTNTIDMWHPPLDLSVMPLQKVYKYAEGYGVICKKNLSPAILFLFAKSSANQLLLMLINAIIFKKQNVIKHFTALKGRLNGFVKFKNN